MTDKFELRKVRYMPTKLEPGILYVAEAFGAAAHLCACGCGTIVRTPLNRWSLTATADGPSLDPSIGNWQEPCQSHYWIERGKVRWAPKWSASQIEAGRRQEEERLRAYYDASDRKRGGKMRRFWRWLKSFVG
jgi:Family of unknown function (DUF6527)